MYRWTFCRFVPESPWVALFHRRRLRNLLSGPCVLALSIFLLALLQN